MGGGLPWPPRYDGTVNHQYCHGIRVLGFSVASIGHDVVTVGSFSVSEAAACASKWHCQVSLVVSLVVYKTLYIASHSCYKQGCGSRSWKWWKQLNFCGSTLMREWKWKQTRKRLILCRAGSGSKNFQRLEVDSEK